MTGKALNAELNMAYWHTRHIWTLRRDTHLARPIAVLRRIAAGIAIGRHRAVLSSKLEAAGLAKSSYALAARPLARIFENPILGNRQDAMRQSRWSLSVASRCEHRG